MDTLFDKEQIEKLKNLCHYTLNTLLPLHKQEACGKGNGFWCTDWWSIEILKFLFLGKATYMAEPPPKRLENNTYFTKDRILFDVEYYKYNTFDALKKYGNLADNLFVGEVGRGIEIMLATFVKKWKTITCYDSNPLFEPVVTDWFRKLEIKVKFTTANTNKVKFKEIELPSVVVLSHGLNKGINADIATNDSIKLFIRDGQVLKGG